MKLMAMLWLLGCALLGAAQPQKTPTYDAVHDFSITANPNGAWSYGWSATLNGTFTLYAAGNGDCLSGLSDWRELTDCPDVVPQPNLAHNDTASILCGPTFCVPPSLLDLHPGDKGQYSILRWTAPAAGRYLVSGTFSGEDFTGPTTTDVHVVWNQTFSLLRASIASYQVPLDFAQVVEAQAGDTIDMAVGFGRDHDWADDGTGVSLKITRLGR